MMSWNKQDSMECYNYPSYIPGFSCSATLFFFASCFYQSVFQWNPIGFMPFTIGKYTKGPMDRVIWECKHRLYSVCHLGNLKAPSVVHDKVDVFFGKLGHSTRPFWKFSGPRWCWRSVLCFRLYGPGASQLKKNTRTHRKLKQAKRSGEETKINNTAARFGPQKTIVINGVIYNIK